MLGIDVSKDWLSCCLLDPKTHDPIWEETVPNTLQGISRLVSKVPPETPWVIEPTGRYSQNVVKQAYQMGQRVLMAPPRKAKAFLVSLQSRAKTDRIDSRGLVLFALSRRLSAYPIKEPVVEQMDQLLSARKGLAQARMRLQRQHEELPHARLLLQPSLKALHQQIRLVDKQIKEMVSREPAFAVCKRLQQVPGIGPVTAAAVGSRLSAKQFARPDQFVAYIGLDVGVRQSGKQKGTTGLTRQGDAELRRLLYVCAQASLRAKDSPFKSQYERELAKGLSSTAALCAIARKMAKLCWSLHKHGTTYDPSRVYQKVNPTSANTRLDVVEQSTSEVVPLCCADECGGRKTVRRNGQTKEPGEAQTA